MRVLFDASVVIPMIADSSLSARLAGRPWDGGHEVVISPAILEEVRKKLFESKSLRRWLAKHDDDLRTFLGLLPTICRVAPGMLEISREVQADPDDDHILAAAQEMEVDYVVSEDHHLLDLSAWRGIRIVDRATMMAELDRRDADENVTGKG